MTGGGDDNFADTPVSIAERRAERDQDASKWTPRDVLVSLLRDIDSGKEVDLDALIVVWRKKPADGATVSRYSLAGPDIHVSLGMLARAQWIINNGGDHE